MITSGKLVRDLVDLTVKFSLIVEKNMILRDWEKIILLMKWKMIVM